MNSITKRWVRSSLLFIIAVLLVAEGLFIYFIYTGYYDSVTREVQGQLDAVTTMLKSAGASGSSENREFILRSAVEGYEEKARFELMLIDEQGNIITSSSGFVWQGDNRAQDILGALYPDTGYSSHYIGDNATGEKVMAMTVHTPYSAGGVVALRVVTSLTAVDKAILNAIALSLIFISAIIFASVISGVYFIRSIVRPLQEVEATATRIAQGDFDIRIDNNNNDEIGRLCGTINNMAEELGRSEQLKNDFISSVSHELRTPLTSIKGWVETIGAAKNPADPMYRRGVQIISSEADRLYDMVEELLDFSRMQSGLSLQPEKLDLAAEVEDAVLLEEQRALNMEIKIIFEAPEAVVPVMGDKNRIRQIFINILDNALKYSKPNSTVQVDILLAEGNAFVSIVDHGQGIPEEDLPHVKTRFYKGKGATRGSGIGLAVVDQLMHAHNGGMTISSTFGKGTQVTLRFPLLTAKQAVLPAQAANETTSTL